MQQQASDQALQLERAAGTRAALQLTLAAPTATFAITRLAPTLPPTWTPTHTLTASPTFTISPTRTPSATRTPTRTRTFTPSATFTASRTFTPSHTPTVTLTPSITPLPTDTPLPPTPEPGAMPPIDVGAYDLFNILLIGNDRRSNAVDYRTDTLVIVSVNRTTGSVSLLSLPRDLYVYIPKYGYDRINTASLWGDLYKLNGGGIATLIAAVRYNLGIRIDRYAQVNFEGFKTIVDRLDGIEIVVDCPITDYRLREGANPNVLANYRPFTLQVGVHRMNGDLALWYVRSRNGTSDFDRNRRQQAMLRAIFQAVRERGQLNQLPALWSDLSAIVKTDLTLADLLSLVPIALNLENLNLRSYFISPQQVTSWQTPQGAAVLVPNREAIRAELIKFLTPPTANTLLREQPTVAIYNGSGNADWDRVAAERLAWEGFAPQAMGESAYTPVTRLYDHTGGAKPSSLRLLLRTLNLSAKDVIDQPDPNADTDFKVVLGTNYKPCTFNRYGVNLP
ncbi:MAG: LytR family transcriptional regulator [Chloroflexota bacterium]|nr:MAG: LytR family transcriptional regulator [Chloroflexota bacterium]